MSKEEKKKRSAADMVAVVGNTERNGSRSGRAGCCRCRAATAAARAGTGRMETSGTSKRKLIVVGRV